MRHRSLDPLADQSNSRDPIPYRRGLRQIITVVRIRLSEAAATHETLCRFRTDRLTHGHWAEAHRHMSSVSRKPLSWGTGEDLLKLVGDFGEAGD